MFFYFFLHADKVKRRSGEIKNVILEFIFRNDILLCNMKKGCLAILVHVFVVVLVFTAGYVFHPFLVVKIPSDGFYDTIFKFGLRSPSEFAGNFGRVDGVTLVMSESVLDKSNQ